jgi:hypothetical protein
MADTLTINPPSILYKQTKKWFADRGAVVLFNFNSKVTSFHSLYSYATPEKIVGINPPDNFKCLAPATPLLLESLQIDLLNDPGTSEELREFMTPLLIYRSGRSSDITDYVLGLEELKAQLHSKSGSGTYELGIATSPRITVGMPFSGVKAYVPELDWFSSDLQKLRFEDIIKIFPESEAEMMKLLIGRAAVGRTGTVHPVSNDVFKHGFRKAGVIIGEPGVGKTITLNGFLDALKYLGYDVTSMGDFGGRFNQGSVVSSHLAYNDDLNLKTLEKMLQAHSFKSVVTGGTEKCENKGVDAIEIVSNAVILANCNEWRSEMTYNLDQGAISRLAPISTYRQYEIKELSEKIGHNAHPAEHITFLANQYNVDPRALYIRAIRDCVDFFIDHTVKGGYHEDVHFYSEKLIPRLRIQMHKNAMEVILRYAFLCYIIRVRACKDDWLPELTLNSLGDVIEALRYISIDMNAYPLRTLLKEDWENSYRAINHYWWAMRKLLMTSLDKCYEVYLSTKANKDVAISTEEVFKVLRLRDGFALGGKITYIVRAWEQLKGERHAILADAKSLMDKSYELIEKNSQLKDDELTYEHMTEDKLNRIILGDQPTPEKRCDSNYLYDPQYDPTKL